MDSFDVRKAVEEILHQMERTGASEKQMKVYRCTSLGAVVRYFDQLGISDVTDEMLDQFVLEQRKCYEQGGFSNWKWRYVRHGSELLKHYAKTGTTEMAPLRPWEPVLRKPRQSVEKDLPSPEQRADPDNIFALVWRVKQELLRMGLAKRTVRHYTTEGLTPILRAHSKQGLECYCPSLTDGMVSEKRGHYEQGLTSRVAYQDLRKADFLLSEMHRTGKLTLSPIPNWGLREPTPVFAALLQDFCDNANRTGILAASTITVAKSAIRIFLFELESRGFYSFEQITIGVPYMKENRNREPVSVRVEVNPEPVREIGGLEKIEDLVVYADGGYSAFPSIVRTQDGNYLLAFRHTPNPDGNSHLDPESATWLLSSADGQSWSVPRELHRPNGYAAQDPVLNVLEDGTVLLTVFFWRFTGEDQKPLLERTLPGGIDIYSVRGMTAYFGGSWCYVSRDHGESWDGPHLITENYAIRGRCAQLPGGMVLAPMYGHTGIVLFASRDCGLTWEPYSFASGPLGKSQTAHEPALLRTQSGRIICFIRTNEEMYYCVSNDDGQSFSAPAATGLPGSVPYDALQLPSGNVYLAYGQRKEPYGIRALLLDGDCNGISIDREFVLRDDGLGGDISYVSSVVLPGGDILTVYYYYTDENEQRRCIAGTLLRGIN